MDLSGDIFNLASTVPLKKKKKKKAHKRTEDVAVVVDEEPVFVVDVEEPKVVETLDSEAESDIVIRGRPDETSAKPREEEAGVRELTPPPIRNHTRHKRRRSEQNEQEPEDEFLRSLQKSTQSFTSNVEDEVQAYIPKQSSGLYSRDEEELEEIRKSKLVVEVLAFFGGQEPDPITMRLKAETKFIKVKKTVFQRFMYPEHRMPDFVFFEPTKSIVYADELSVYSPTKVMKQLRRTEQGEPLVKVHLMLRQDALKKREEQLAQRQRSREEADTDVSVIEEVSEVFDEEDSDAGALNTTQADQTEEADGESYFKIELRDKSATTVTLEVSESTKISKIAEYYLTQKGLPLDTKLKIVGEGTLNLNSTVGEAELEEEDILDVQLL